MKRGIWYAAGAYVVWGVLPIYWKLLQAVPALEILAHRIVWACLFTLLLVLGRRQLRALGAALRRPKILVAFAASGLLLTFNWYIYIWAVNDGHIVETSLGYFINPLINVLLGVLFLGERLRIGQVVAIGMALLGVIVLAVHYGSPPWIALALAGTFGLYGLLRKTASLDSLVGLSVETLIVLPLALGYLFWLGPANQFGQVSLTTELLMIGTGIITAIPLLLFAAGARQITMTSLGLLQYIAPTLQFSIGVLIYGEPLTTERLAGFVLIWIALAIYSLESLWRTSGRGAAGRARPA
jgi:chloramphenicol-sensitive protein RarD